MAVEMKLNRAAIRALEPGQRITQGGITAERTAAGEIRISVNTQVDGRRVHRRGFLTFTEAKEFIEQARTDARHGRLNLPTGRKLALAFASAAEQYLARMEQSNGKNLVAKRRQLRLYLVPAFGQRGSMRSRHSQSSLIRSAASMLVRRRRRSTANSQRSRTCSIEPSNGNGSTGYLPDRRSLPRLAVGSSRSTINNATR